MPFIKTKLKNLLSDEVIERNFKLNQPIQDVSLAERKLEYLYLEGKDYLFFDVGNLEQVLVPSQVIGDKVNYLKEGIELKAMFYGDSIFSVELPQFLELMVVKTEESESAVHVANATKLAILETGAKSKSPCSSNQGTSSKSILRQTNIFNESKTHIRRDCGLKQIKELMAAMERAGIKKLTIKQKGGDELHLERQEEHPSQPHTPVAAFYPPVYSHPPAREAETVAGRPRSKSLSMKKRCRAEERRKSGKFVTAPLVGTFYAAASPEDPHFVKVGDRVDENTVVCIIEAMKVMNEVKAGISGTIAEILVENAHPVEFGTKLFRIV